MSLDLVDNNVIEGKIKDYFESSGKEIQISKSNKNKKN